MARIAALLLLLASAAAFAVSQEAVRQAIDEARERSDEQAEGRRGRFRELVRLRKDLRYIAEELDRETIGPEKELEAYSQGGLARIRKLRRQGDIAPALAPALARLEKIYAQLPQKTFAREYAPELSAAVAHELRWAAEEAHSKEELLAILERDLALPEGGAVMAEALFPLDVPLSEFKRLGPIRIFLVKHRLKIPASYAAATPRELEQGKKNVQVGVEVSGAVTAVDDRLFDHDYCFDIGNIHFEITPEWRLLHPKMHLPKLGEKVRARGWTYFDIFHKAEPEYDPEDPTMGATRVTQWEVHPVYEVDPLP